MDRIEFYSDQDIKAWIDEFQRSENLEKIVLPSVPFSWHEIIREWRKRQDLYDL